MTFIQFAAEEMSPCGTNMASLQSCTCSSSVSETIDKLKLLCVQPCINAFNTPTVHGSIRSHQSPFYDWPRYSLSQNALIFSAHFCAFVILQAYFLWRKVHSCVLLQRESNTRKCIESILAHN